MIKVTLITLKGCPHCEATKKVLDKLKSKYNNLAVTEAPFETEQGKELAQKYNIKAAPGIIINDKFFKQGEATEQELEEQFKKFSTH